MSMEVSVTFPASVKSTSSRKPSSSHTQKDLWSVAKQGSLSELESTLSSLKKNGVNINSRNEFGLTPLHIATWRNHVPIVKRLLAAGADPDARDGESGWSSLHRALHFGHLAVASILLQSGASLILEDPKSRTPVDLLSGPVSQVVGDEIDSVTTEVFSWGSGTNYQLGTGNAHIQKMPCKVDALQGSSTKLIAASKFHSVAVGARGELYTWGFGRGGRLGHPDFDIHSGQAAIITPRQVTFGLGSRRVKAIAAAKHHMVIATESGDVFTWGSNREGQLGYTSVDTQPTPRRVSSLKAKVISVAAANKHTAVVAETGEVFTWGCNKEGQLGYGTSNSASNYTPRLVEYLKGKTFKVVSTAKYHTIVLGVDGEVFTWGHRLVTPRRVIIARNLKKNGSSPLKFHRMERLHVSSVVAGMVHSTALTDDGSLFYWISSDPDLRCHQLYSMCARNVVSISAGKYWTAAATTSGDVYMWDGKKYKDEIPIPTRLHGVKHASSVCVGETHLLVVCSLYQPIYTSKMGNSHKKQIVHQNEGLDELDEKFAFGDLQENMSQPGVRTVGVFDGPAPSLKSLCEKVAAEFLVEPRNAMQLLEIADTLEADDLRRHCEEIVIHNLDYIFTVSSQAISNASPEILVRLEKLLDTRSSEPWSYRRLPTPTATFPAVIDSEEEETVNIGHFRLRDNHRIPVLKNFVESRGESFLRSDSSAEQAVVKQIRAFRKKLQQIEMLEAKQLNGHVLDDQQVAKLQTKSELESALLQLDVPLENELQSSLLDLSDGKRVKKTEVSRKQRRKSKQKPTQFEVISAKNEVFTEDSFAGFKNLQISREKEEVDVDESIQGEIAEVRSLNNPKGISKSRDNKTSQSPLPKKKSKRGGLSLFLSGALDDSPKPAIPPPTPKSEGPAWGGVKITKGPNSLRDIQNEQSSTKELSDNRLKDWSDSPVDNTSGGSIRLGSFLPCKVSSPITVAPARVVPTSEGEKNTPPWSSAGNSPVFSRPSLRDIQQQQEKKHNLSHSPKIRTSGFSVSQASPPDSGSSKDTLPNRWFKPEIEAPSSIRSIQIEERAMKDLKRFYSNVKLVKADPKLS